MGDNKATSFNESDGRRRTPSEVLKKVTGATWGKRYLRVVAAVLAIFVGHKTTPGLAGVAVSVD